MTREQITTATAYYRMFRAGSWVSVPRDGLLDGMAALEAAWKELDDLRRRLHEVVERHTSLDKREYGERKS